MPSRYHQPPLLKFCRGRGRMPINNNDHWWKPWGGGADMTKPSTAQREDRSLRGPQSQASSTAQREDRSLRGPQSQASYTVHTAAVVVVALVLAVVPAGQALAATWSVTATPDPPSSWGSRLTGVDASSADDAWAVGYAEYGSAPTARPITARWTGAEWTVVPSPSPTGANAATLHGVKTLGAGNAWAVGQAQLPAGRPTLQTLIVHWDGESWSIVPSPNPDQGQNLLSAVDGVAADDVWAVGGMGFDGYGSQPISGLILHWNGASWTQSAIPAHPTLRVFELRDVVAVSASDVWAVGVGFSWQRFSQVPAILHWNGQAWQHVAAPSPGDAFSGVCALSPTSVYAVGNAGSRTLVVRWNGSTWTTETTPSPGLLLAAAAAGTGSVWAVGLQVTGSGEYRTLAIRTSDG